MNQQAPILRKGYELPGRLTADDFCAMIALGAFEDMRAELVEGIIEKMAPAHGDHGQSHATLAIKLGNAMGVGRAIAVDLVVRIDDSTARAADIAVGRAARLSPGPALASDLLLVVEIADTTLSRDLGDKARDYARAGLEHYWVVDLAARVVHVMRSGAGGDYAERSVVRFGEPLAVPGTDRTISID